MVEGPAQQKKVRSELELYRGASYNGETKMVVPFAILLLSAIATASSADGSPYTVAPYIADYESSKRSHEANAPFAWPSADPANTNPMRLHPGNARQRLHLSGRLAVPRAVLSAANDAEASPDRRTLSATNPHVSAPSLSSGPNLVSTFAFMQPRDPSQVSPAPPSLAPPVPDPPIPGPPPVKSPPVKPPPVKSPPVKPPPVKPPPSPPPPPFFQPWPVNGQGVFNVLQFGARADGRTDNTDAFRRALQTACAWGEARSAYARLVVPASGLFQIFPIELEGPCGAGLEVQIFLIELEGPCGADLEIQINGGIAGAANVTSYPKPRKSNAWALLFFRGVPNLAVTGGGWMDGRGAGFWAKGKGKKRPALLFLMHCDNATVQGIGMTNPGKAHLKVYGSNGLLIEGITTRSPFNSPNTDSIQLSKIENGIIRNSHLQGGE
ncbi:unnamed protein product [Closterium sp. Yama58-4]|nr:unnamed protein product [Closterium sp. Yama58-4]